MDAADSPSRAERRLESHPMRANQDRVPPDWMHLPPGPQKEAASLRWIADELHARGRQETALTFAAAWCPAWSPGKRARVNWDDGDGDGDGDDGGDERRR